MTTPGFRPTHVVPQDGMPAWDAPDPVRPTVPLDALLPVRLVERRGDWGHVLCANGWSAWVDGRLLVAVPQEPLAAAQPPARTADPGPLLARAEETLGRYRQAVAELAAGHLDREAFHTRTRGMRVGIVVEGEAVWLYEAEHERWVYCDGTRLSTYAVARPLDAAGAGGGGGGEGATGAGAVVPDAAPAPGGTGPGGTGPSGAGPNAGGARGVPVAAPSGRSAAGPEPSRPAEPPESHGSPERRGAPAAVGHAHTQVVPGAGPEPTQVVGGAEAEEDIGHAPTRLVPKDGDG
ncbi:hypothetical protein ACFYXC_34470 [Streptomyces sp. NPDC002701]|uniref:hypothetical protein n=1 Tax=Streptomyces sp. NPDC002701 TaxID=3364661 RepID=UPI0036B99AFE